MSNEKLKSENYTNIGGINQKFSPYMLGPMEFLDLRNLDFHMPGALSQRWGSTTYLAATTSIAGRVTNLVEFTKLGGFSQIIVGYTGSMYSYANGSLSGMTAGLAGSTFVATIFFQRLVDSGGAYINLITGEADWAGDPALNLNPSSSVYATMVICAQNFGANDFDSVTFKNFQFLTNGNLLAKYDGATMSRAMLPYPAVFDNAIASKGSNDKLTFGNLYSIALAYLSLTGDEGPILPLVEILTNVSGASYSAAELNAIVPQGFGITAINVYLYQGPTTGGTWGATTSSNWNLPYYYYKSVGVTAGASLTTIDVGINGDPGYFNAGKVRYFGDQLALGITITPGAPGLIQYSPFLPKYIEQYQNSLFFAGFSGIASTVVFTETATSEVIRPSYSFEVRTNDGDSITGLKSYSQRLMIGKFESIHQLTGDNAQNFSLKEVSDEFGVYNHKCMITYGDLFAFLDVKGVVQYNGAGLNVLSYKIQPLIDRINQAAAVTHACMAHDKLRNQLLISVPIDGASLNNITLVYDYIANAWTTYDGYIPEAYMRAKGSLGQRSLFYGGWSGQIAYFGASLTQDYNGQGFTTYVKSRFIKEMGDSVQKQSRRLFLNIDAPSATLAIPINFYQDYGSSVVLTETMVISGFQQRIDFGISSKSLAYELYQISTNVPFRIHGFTLEQRFQRKV